MNPEEISKISENLAKVNKNLGSVWLSFAKGLLYGFGSVLGAGIAIILIGWFLNIIGVIPAFQKQADQWREVFVGANQIRSIIPDGNPGQ